VTETIRFLLGTAFILCGLAIFIIEIFGNYRFGYVLNRMQAAAIGDSFGIVLCLVGMMFYFGWALAGLKLLFVEIFLWCSSPVSSHLVAKLEAETNEHLDREVKIRDLTEGEEGDPCKR
jgi:multicomponent Na+:H+ antiporter subunit G